MAVVGTAPKPGDPISMPRSCIKVCRVNFTKLSTDLYPHYGIRTPPLRCHEGGKWIAETDVGKDLPLYADLELWRRRSEASSKGKVTSVF